MAAGIGGWESDETPRPHPRPYQVSVVPAPLGAGSVQREVFRVSFMRKESPQMIPTIGRIVHYRLTDQDAVEINRRRTTGTHIADRLRILGDTGWPTGAQAHIGNKVAAHDVFPAMIVRTWGKTEGSCCQLQVFLDGNDTYWATSRSEGDLAGMWAVPPRV